MKVYIAGQITDLEWEVAYEAFARAENAVLAAGHAPLNPMVLVDQTPGREYGEYLADALRVLLTEADAIYYLPNWQDSKGARIERYIAETLGIPEFVIG